VNPDPWEEAYLRFETPDQEIRKCIRRLRGLGADHWPREARIVDLFCGRGSGMQALHRLGFAGIEGVDLSPTLAARYDGPGTVHVADCRNLPFDDGSKDIAIVQGGLHHLPALPGDLEQTLAQVHRVLRPDGLFIAAEPWLTPFLRLVHFLSHQRPVRAASAKVDALATMIEYERRTYEQWLGQPRVIQGLMGRYFKVERWKCAWGKMVLVGRK
jgi:SAM-dependent methyltransferase